MAIQPMDVYPPLRLHVHRGTLLLLNAVSHCGHTHLHSHALGHTGTCMHESNVYELTFSVHYTLQLCKVFTLKIRHPLGRPVSAR